MPLPGDQYSGGNGVNPFEERVPNAFTACEIATLQGKLNQQLGPEFISTRSGHGGGKVAYLEGNKAIALANQVFGFNGWSSSLGQVQIDYVDEHQNGKVSLGLSIVMRITLKDGTYHEDIGYGSIVNGNGKAASFEKAKKEAATDGLKRALRTFGNVLGNCLYDKEYLKKVQAMKAKPIKFEEGALFRHPAFAPPPPPQEQASVKQEQRTPARPNQVLRTRTEHLGGDSFSAEFDDDFDGNLFDGVEVSEAHGDEVSFDASIAPVELAKRITAPVLPRVVSARTSPVRNTGPPRQPPPRTSGVSNVQQRQNPGPPGASGPGPLQRPPQTPVQQQNQRPMPNNGQPQPNSNNASGVSRPPQQPSINQQSSNQGLRPTPPQPQQPTDISRAVPSIPHAQANGGVPLSNNKPPVGFVNSRAAELLQSEGGASTLANAPAFNPHAESPVPLDKRTPGFDNKRSAPVKRQDIGAPPAPPPAANPANNSRQPGAAGAAARSTNFANPHQDPTRRIGMPGAQNYAMSPSANRGAYKPPTFANGAGGVKRERPPLQDVSNQGQNGTNESGDVKRQRVEAPGAENTNGAVTSS